MQLPILISRYLPLNFRESGQDLAEYGILVALIAIIVVAGVTIFGQQVLAFYAQIADQLPF